MIWCLCQFSIPLKTLICTGITGLHIACFYAIAIFPWAAVKLSHVSCNFLLSGCGNPHSYRALACTFFWLPAQHRCETFMHDPRNPHLYREIGSSHRMFLCHCNFSLSGCGSSHMYLRIFWLSGCGSPHSYRTLECDIQHSRGVKTFMLVSLCFSSIQTQKTLDR